jgi:hypothetical protein
MVSLLINVMLTIQTTKMSQVTPPDEHKKDHDLPEESASNRQPLSRFHFGEIVAG